MLTKDFLRKYIHYAKKQVAPVLSDDAMEAISSEYATMRAKIGVQVQFGRENPAAKAE